MTPQLLTAIRKRGVGESDSIRVMESTHMTNSDIMARIRTQLANERSARDFAIRNRPAWQVALTWDRLLTTKLFNNTH